VSGGADSVALLAVAAELRGKTGMQAQLWWCTSTHNCGKVPCGEACVAKLAVSMGLEFHGFRGVARKRKERANLEGAAAEGAYDYLCAGGMGLAANRGGAHMPKTRRKQ